MKKNVLSLSITAALLGLGFAGGAQAITTLGGTDSTTLAFNPNGTGQILLVPYFSTQGANTTMINITNTTTLGKAVKVRFRGASNSDDIFDFQVFMSPQDVWTASISQGADGKSKLSAGGDVSCTKPEKAKVEGSFVTDRLDQTLSAAALAANTREGYVEILNMADIPNSTDTKSLSYAITHKDGKAPCTGDAWAAIDTNLANVAAYAAAGMTPPTEGLMANWTILNLDNATTFGGAATALKTDGIYGNLVYFPQKDISLSDASLTANLYTADPLLVGGTRYKNSDGTATAFNATIAMALYDLPDLSTPYTATGFAGSTAPVVQAWNLTGAIATTSIRNEYLTGSGIAAATDWVFSMPTRRYSVGLDYTSGDAVYNTGLDGVFFAAKTGVNAAGNVLVDGRQVCVTNVTPKAYDREEGTPSSSSVTVISPSTPTKPTSFCGEAAVLSVNTPTPTVSSVVGATVAIKGLLANAGAYANGWFNLSTPGLSHSYSSGPIGLPILGSAFVSGTGTNAAGKTFVLGAAWEHRYSRTNAQYTAPTAP